MIVWVLSTNPTERALIVAELAEEGFAARGFESVTDLMADLAVGQTPDVLILDAGEVKLAPDTWKAISSRAPAARTIVITGLLGSSLPADRVVRRPFSIGELADKIKAMMGGSP
jgi:DNA-binding response OmpR family regulator